MRRRCLQKQKSASEPQVWQFYKLSRTLLTFHWKPEPEIFNGKFSTGKTSEVVHDSNWLLLIEIATCTGVLLRNINISARESKVSPTCYLQDTGFHMIHHKKLVNTIEGIIKCFGILARASNKLLDEDLEVLVDQLRGILHRLRRIVEESDVNTSPYLTYCRWRRNRLIFPQPRETWRGGEEIVPRQGQIELVLIARLRIRLRAQSESVDYEVLESVVEVTQTQVEETDMDSDCDIPDLIDSQGNIAN